MQLETLKHDLCDLCGMTMSMLVKVYISHPHGLRICVCCLYEMIEAVDKKLEIE